MLIRKYKPGDCTDMAQIFYDTVHSVNSRDYTREQLDAWAAGRVDLETWNRTFLKHYTFIAEMKGKIVGFTDIEEKLILRNSKCAINGIMVYNRINKGLFHTREEQAK